MVTMKCSSMNSPIIAKGAGCRPVETSWVTHIHVIRLCYNVVMQPSSAEILQAVTPIYRACLPMLCCIIHLIRQGMEVVSGSPVAPYITSQLELQHHFQLVNLQF